MTIFEMSCIILRSIVRVTERGHTAKGLLGGANSGDICRISYAGINLNGLPSPGFSKYLEEDELRELLSLIL